MTPIPKNPFDGLTVDCVRRSFEASPVKSAIASAAFGASLIWGVKAAKRSGAIGAALKGVIALAVMNRARKTLVGAGNGRQIAAA